MLMCACECVGGGGEGGCVEGVPMRVSVCVFGLLGG